MIDGIGVKQLAVKKLSLPYMHFLTEVLEYPHLHPSFGLIKLLSLLIVMFVTKKFLSRRTFLQGPELRWVYLSSIAWSRH